MSRSRVVGAALLAMAVSLFMPAAAYAGGAWRAVFTEWRTWPRRVAGQIRRSDHDLASSAHRGNCIVLLEDKPVAGADCTLENVQRVFGILPPATGYPDGAHSGIGLLAGLFRRPSRPLGRQYWQLNAQLRVVLPPVEVPDVLCTPVKEAEARLKQAGLNFVITGDVGDVVTGQRPLPREQIQQNGKVTLFRLAVPVPNVVGSTYQEARSALEADLPDDHRCSRDHRGNRGQSGSGSWRSGRGRLGRVGGHDRSAAATHHATHQPPDHAPDHAPDHRNNTANPDPNADNDAHPTGTADTDASTTPSRSSPPVVPLGSPLPLHRCRTWVRCWHSSRSGCLLVP